MLLGPGDILLLRHAQRGPIPEGSDGDLVPLTERGRADARDFGRRFGLALGSAASSLRGLSSPVGRCVETARLVLASAGSVYAPICLDILADAYLADPAEAYPLLSNLGYDRVIHRYIKEGIAPGFHPLAPASERLLGAMRSEVGKAPLLCVSHDVIILPFLAYYAPREKARLRGGWIDFLEGALIRADGETFFFSPDDIEA
jgi:broad specificity phosphatase PhoE